MGIHIFVEDDNGNEVSKKLWNSYRVHGDKEFFSWILDYEEIERYPGNGEEVFGQWGGRRPKDFVKFKKDMVKANLPNIERFQHLVSLLEQNENLWITFS